MSDLTKEEKAEISEQAFAYTSYLVRLLKDNEEEVLQQKTTAGIRKQILFLLIKAFSFGYQVGKWGKGGDDNV